MFEEVKYYQDVMEKYFNQPMKLTRQEEENYQKATNCHICGFKIDDSLRNFAFSPAGSSTIGT